MVLLEIADLLIWYSTSSKMNEIFLTQSLPLYCKYIYMSLL